MLSVAARWIGVAVAVTGAWHLAAWVGGAPVGRGLSAITIKANLALCLTLLGIALALGPPWERGTRGYAASWPRPAPSSRR